MQKIIFIVLLTLLGREGFSQSEKPDYWVGNMNRDGSILNVAIELNIQLKKPIGFFNVPSQKASGIPLDSIFIVKDSATFQLMSDPVTFFKCSIKKDSVTGQFTQEGFSKGTITLIRSVKPAITYLFTDTSFTSGNNKIACRIYFPKENHSFPAVIFMHGSGGEGMFANQYLAEYMASKGIVTLIQDKQGVGKSTGNWTTADFNKLTDDYVNAIHFLKTFHKVNQNAIGIYGHSQGGTLAPLLATKCKDVHFVIAAASVGDTIYKQDLYRVENNLISNGFAQVEIGKAMSYYKQWLNIARTGMGFEKLDSLNNVSKNKSWFEWVEAPPKEHWIWNFYKATGDYNSLNYWRNISVPVLLVYGEKDEIEDIKTYIHNIDTALITQQKNKDVTNLILPDAQHNLCVFPEHAERFFWWHLSPGYEDLITGWIKYRF